MSYTLASAILKGRWLLETNTARSYLPIVANVIKGQTSFEAATDEEKQALEPYNVTANFTGTQQGSTQETKTIAFVPVRGVLVKYTESCGPRGMTEIANNIKRLDADTTIDAIVLKIDSPGGMVDGTQTLADAINDCQKPVIAFIDDGMAASAAYWIASACDEIYASQKTDNIGSIGVYMTLADWKAYYESQGLPVHEIYADQSSEKNLEAKQAFKKNYAPIKKQLLNPIADEFIAAVKNNRKGKLNEAKGDPFKGAIYMAEEAVQLGLIDGLKSFDETVQRAAELSALSAGGSITAQTEHDMTIKINNQQLALAAVLGIAFAEGETEKELDLTQENIVAVNAELVKLTAEKTAAETAKTTAENSVKEWEGKYEELKKDSTGNAAAANDANNNDGTTKNWVEENNSISASVKDAGIEI
jgi:signal peptide peptidase SppA